MKNLFLIALMLTISFAAPTTKDKIAKTNKELQSVKKESQAINDKISELGSEILKEQNEAKTRENEIKELSLSIENLKDKYANEEKELEKLNSQNAALLNLQNELEAKISDIVSKELAFDVISDENITKNSDSIVAGEILEKLGSVMSDELATLVKSYENNLNFIAEQDKKIKNIKNNMNEYHNKKLDLNSKQAAQSAKVAQLQKSKDSYIARLEKINDEQDAIAKTLSELKIINDKEEKEKARKAEQERLAKIEAEKKRELERKKAAATKARKQGKEIVEEPVEVVEEEPIKDVRVQKINSKVKQYGSSYQSSRVKRYTGAKTIAPLDGAYIKRKFGDYKDPVYNIKLFNENIVLASRSGDTKVKAVLGGKVIFAKDTAVLDKVVIIEHSGGIHTIYAHLNQIPSTIKVGSRVQKGYVIGRVSTDLTFEVTQQNYHVNPLDLISLK